MGQNGHATVLVIHQSSHMMTVAKKAPTIPHRVLGGIHTRKGNYLRQTSAGKCPEKSLADEENPTAPEGSCGEKDTGFPGDAPDGVKTFPPCKQPQGKALTPEQTEQNRLISSIRIVIAQIMSGRKRCRIVTDLLRNPKEQYDALVLEIACALHNFRVHGRQS
jgi:hypothetical protein